MNEKDYDSLQERFQALCFENHSLKERIIQLEDKIEELEGTTACIFPFRFCWQTIHMNTKGFITEKNFGE